MKALPLQYAGSIRGGFTLLEVIVVLILLAVAAAVVAPSFSFTGSEPSSPLRGLVATAREAAIRRGETVHLRIDRSGTWQAVAGTPSRSEVLMVGRLAGAPGGPVDLIFSPLGTCGLAVESQSVSLGAFDALTCEAESR